MRADMQKGWWAELRTRLAQDGSAVFALRAAAWIAARATRGRVRVLPYHFYAQPVPPRAQPAREGSVTVERAMPRTTSSVRFRGRRQSSPRASNSGARNAWSPARGERFVGFLWLKPQEYVEDEVRCIYTLQPPDRTAWDFDVYVDPQFRLSKAFVRLWDTAHATLRREGRTWTMSRIVVFNRESIRAHARLGAVRVCSALFLAGRRWQVSFFTVRPYLHAGGREACPALLLTAPS
jgi:hypothetical protein